MNQSEQCYVLIGMYMDMNKLSGGENAKTVHSLVIGVRKRID